MNIKPVEFLNTTLPAKKAFQIPTPPQYPKLHTLSIINGKRGGGKTVCVTNYLKKMLAEGLLDKIFVVTPTYQSNREIWSICELTERDCRPPSLNVLSEIVSEMEAIKEEWDDFERQLDLYKQFQDYMDHPTADIDEEKLILFYEHGYVDVPHVEKPKWKYQRGDEEAHPPRFAVVLDDCLNAEVMRRPSAGLVNFCIRHRHICGGLGCSVFMLVQTYCGRGGIDRAIRENTTHLYLFRIADIKQIKKVYEECDLNLEFDEFLGMLKLAHDVPFNFLMIDFNPDDPTEQFRNGWNEFLIPPSLGQKNILDE